MPSVPWVPTPPSMLKPERLDLPCVYARKRRRTRAALLQDQDTESDVAERSSPAPVPEIRPPRTAPSQPKVAAPPRVHADPPSVPSATSLSPRTRTRCSAPASDTELISPRHDGAHNMTVGFLNPPIARSRTPTPVSDGLRRGAAMFAEDDPSEPRAFLPANHSRDGATELDRSRAPLAPVHAALKPALWTARPPT